MTDEIKKGDVVFLKSRVGFLMTVGHISDNGEIADCYRAIDSGETQDVKEFNLPVCVLKVYKPSGFGGG